MLRMNEDISARQALALYFEGKGPSREGKGISVQFESIASVLSDDYKKAFDKVIRTNLNMKQLQRWRKIT